MSEFDWVTARSQCSAAQLFKLLQHGVESDVQIRNQLRDDEHVEFKFAGGGARFSVIREAEKEEMQSVDFALDRDTIKISGSLVGSLTLIVGLSNTGKCNARIVDYLDSEPAELDLWQIRRKALENLFWPIRARIEHIGKQK